MRSFLVGLVGLVLAGSFTACVPAAGQSTYGATYTSEVDHGTGVYVNGEQLTVEQKAQLDELLGETLPQGRYTVDADGNMGFEGQPPRVNLVALARQREPQHEDREPKQPFNMYSRDSAGQGSSIVSDGDCTIVSTPTGSLSSGC